MNCFVGLTITDGYCNGYFGRVYDLAGSIIIHAGSDYIVIRTEEGDVRSAWFCGDSPAEVVSCISNWTRTLEEEEYGD